MARKSATTDAPRLADARIVVLHGKETFLRSHHTAELRSALEQAHTQIDVLTFDGLTAAVADVLDECRSFGLMHQHKLVVVDNADQLVKGDNRPFVERYAAAPSDTATLLLRCDLWHRSNLDERIQQIGAIIKCEEPKPHEAVRWVADRARSRHDAPIDRDAAQALVDRVGLSLARLDSELAKLAVAAGPGKPITLDHVHELVGASREEEAWSIQRELLSRDPARALRQLHTILDNAPRGAHVPVTWSCVDLARKIHSVVQGAAQRVDRRQLESDLKLWGDSKDAILAEARRVAPDSARDLLAAAVRADYNQKRSIGDPYRTLEVLALRFASL